MVGIAALTPPYGCVKVAVMSGRTTFEGSMRSGRPDRVRIFIQPMNQEYTCAD